MQKHESCSFPKESLSCAQTKIMRIIQITDIHIAPLGAETILNIDVWGQFQRVLAEAKTFQPDWVVITGDLCYQEGDVGVYHWIRTQLEETGLNYQVIAGNHDDALMMATVFGLPKSPETNESFYALSFDMGQIIFLDTAQKVLSARQWTWFYQQLRAPTPSLIMMHHPPVLAQTYFMDTHHSFLQRAEFAQALAAAPKPIAIFCGHYHIDRTILKDDFRVFITPSSMAQIDGTQKEYTLDHLRPGFRIIDWDGKNLSTEVRWLPITSSPG